MRAALEALAARLREDAEIARDIADAVDAGERRRWAVEAETYGQAAAIVGAAAEFPDGVDRIRTVIQMHCLGKNSLPREVWLRVGAMVERRCASRRSRGASS